MAISIDVVVFKCKICLTGISEIVRYSRDKKAKFRLPLKLSLLRISRPKYARASPKHLAHTIWPIPHFRISSKSVHFRRSYCRTREDRFLPHRVFTRKTFLLSWKDHEIFPIFSDCMEGLCCQ